MDNPDFVHLKSLSDMCKQIILWATAADAQIQVLLAKRAPNMTRVPPPLNPCGEISLASEVTPLPTNKAELHAMAVSLGIPETLLSTKDYLNGNVRPTVDGIKQTQDLIGRVLDKIAVGEDPSNLW